MPGPASLKRDKGQKSRLPSPRLFRPALAVALVVITVLALMPADSAPARELNDKVSHFLAFYALAFLTDYAFPAGNRLVVKLAPLLAYGLGIELVQRTLPSRMFSWLDLAADSAGLLFYGLSLLLVSRLPGKSLPR